MKKWPLRLLLRLTIVGLGSLIALAGLEGIRKHILPVTPFNAGFGTFTVEPTPASAAAAPQTPFIALDVKSEFQEIQRSSLYVPMRDGLRIAVDVLLPKALRDEQKVPTLFKIARFGRASLDGKISEEDIFWVQHGFARVLIDERGTGASFGTSRYGTDTIHDLYDIVEWVVKRPWSNGRVGAIGVSVEGTASELLAATGHPAVRAVAPWFSDYNYYTDLVRPGGVFNEWILKNFEDFTLQMDSGGAAKRVDSDPDGILMKQAIAEHRNNLNIYSVTKDASFIDDRLSTAGKSLLEISIPGAAAALRKSPVPMLIFASWYDAGTTQGTIRRFQEFSNPQTIFIGAWSHGANSNADPFFPPKELMPSRIQQRLEALQFFNRYLKGEPKKTGLDRQLSYYTIGSGEWKSTAVWPPPGLRRLTYQLNANGDLGSEKFGGKLKIRLQTTSTGDLNRWHTQFGGGPVDYSAALKQMNELISFRSAPLVTPLRITGQPVLRMRLTCSAQDPSLIAYLIAVDPTGRSFYITEGHLRLLDRKLDASEQTLHTYTRRNAQPIRGDGEIAADLTLLPTSVFLQKGTRLQLLLASGDNATFATFGAYEVTISPSSQLELPVQ